MVKRIQAVPSSFQCLANYQIKAGRRKSILASDGIVKKLLEENEVVPGVVCRTEMWQLPWDKTTPPMEVTSYYTTKGDYIGDLDTGEFLVKKKGILPELSDPSHNVCSIGFCAKENKWYGWSHRAMCGFGLGDKYHCSGTAVPDPRPTGNPNRVINTLEEARESACNFARDVS